MKHFNPKQIPFAGAYSRREMLEWMGSAAALALLGWGWDRSLSEDRLSGLNLQSIADAAITPSCVVRPEQTEGPYFVDEKLNRSDIRSDPSDGSMRQGVPLRLAFHVSRVNGSSCTPFSGVRVDVWQCDALGVYSDVRDPRADTRGKQFLRGYQLTNTKGAAEFVTIYPGWYPGRAVHIHFKIRSDSSSRRGLEFTSQLYFDEAISDEIYKQAPYNAKGRRSVTNENDFGFRRGGKQLMPALTKDAQGYAATFDIGLQIT